MALISIQNYADDASSLFQRPSDTWTLPISNLYGPSGYKRPARLAFAPAFKQMTLRIALPVNSGVYEFSRARVLSIGGLNCLAGTSVGVAITGFKSSATLLSNTYSASYWNSGGLIAPGYARAIGFELPDELVYDSINDEPIEFLSLLITFTTDAAVAFADIGKVWIGPAFDLVQDANWSAPMDFGSTVAVGPGGGRAQRSLGKMTRRLSLPVSYLEKAQVVTNQGLRQRLAIAGMNREMVVIPSRESLGFSDAGAAFRSEFGIYGYMDQNSVDFTRTETTDWGARFGVVEFVP